MVQSESTSGCYLSMIIIVWWPLHTDKGMLFWNFVKFLSNLFELFLIL